MQLKKVLPYNIKRNIRRAVLATGLAGATLVGCKENKIEPLHDVEITFLSYTAGDVLATPVLQKYIDDPTVRTIYMIPEGKWTGFSAKNIRDLRNYFFQPIIELSPKMCGRGDFMFKPGLPSLVPEDSLWYVQQGWTVNQYLQTQKSK